MITQLKKGTLELCVLALLSREDLYGYALVTRISEEINVTVGTIYPLLKRIRADGSVETYTVDSDAGPSRKYYRLTDQGRKVLGEKIGQWKQFSAKINTIISEVSL